MNAVQPYPSIKRPVQLAARVSGRFWSQNRPLTRAAKPDVRRRIPRAIARSLALWVCLLVSLPSIVLAQTTRPMSMDEAMALLDGERAWTDFPPVETILERHPEEHVLKDMLFVLDPGHGGDAHLPNWKRGPTGVREAEINLRVAKLLERMLTDAGAKVELTRDIDRDLSLADRAKVANDLNADLFISLHHNAASRPVVNYTSIYLHGDLATAGPELDAARHIARELTRTMRTDVGYSSPLMSDFQMFKSGFGVLRNARVPAMLLESSFHSNPEEEQRLDDPRHNLREAYAIYRGLVEWAFAGRPTQTMTWEFDQGDMVVTYQLDTGLPKWWGDEFRGPVPSSIALTVNGEEVAHTFDAETRTVTARFPRLEAPFEIFLRHSNVFGNRNNLGGLRYFVDEETHDVMTEEPPSTRSNAKVAQPWLKRRTVKTPIVLLDGGATSESQAVLDAIEMPEGSAMTIAKIDVDGLRAVRWRDTGDDGFYPASTVKLATALMTLRQVDDLEPELPFQAWLVSLDDSEPKPVAELLTAMIKESDNDDFNTLQEVAGFAETRDFLKEIGCESLLIRRHFTRPHWNHSRPARFVSGEAVVDVDARPAPDMPLNAAGGESNWSSTDDLVRLAAATFLTDARDLDGFGVLTDAMAETNEPFVDRGLDRLGNFKQYNKPGWWPGDGSFCDVAYVFDRETNLHYLVGIYWQGEIGDGDEEELDPAREGIADAIEEAFAAIRDGRIRL